MRAQTGAGVVHHTEATPSSTGTATGTSTGPTTGQQAWDTTKNVASATYNKVLLRRMCELLPISQNGFSLHFLTYVASAWAQTAETAQAAKESEAYKVRPCMARSTGRNSPLRSVCTASSRSAGI